MTDVAPEAADEVDFNRRLGLAIAAARRSRNLSVDQLAERSGIHRTTIYKLETSEHPNPTLDNLLNIQRALGLTSLERLFDALLALSSDLLSSRRPDDVLRGTQG